MPYPPSRPPLEPEPLAALAPSWRVGVVDACPSTHLALASEARAGRGVVGRVLVAEHQTAGRGRLDRTWTTPPRAALTASVAVAPPMADEDWPWLPLLLGTAVVAGIRAAGGPVCGLKWPNDVMTVGPELKLGGLLAERVEPAVGPTGGPAGPTGPLAVLSLGLNVTTTPDELPLPSATSLTDAGWAAPDRTRLLVEVLTALGERLTGWSDGSDGLRREYVAACVTVGRHVRVERPASPPLLGVARDIGHDGSLVVDTGSALTRVNAGDVVHVRPG